MSKPIDQERQAFDRWYREYKCLSDSTDTTFIDGAFDPYKAWQARAQQPASVAVPEGWALVPVEPTREMLAAGVDIAVGVVPIYAAMLAAAPHPVSGEQKRITSPYLMYCLGAWWTCEERQVNAALDRNYRLIDLANPPAAQDVADPLPGLRLALDLLTEDGQGFMQKRVIVDKLIELGVTLPPEQLM